MLGIDTSLRGSDIREDSPGRERLFPDAAEWINEGYLVAAGRTRQLSPGHATD